MQVLSAPPPSRITGPGYPRKSLLLAERGGRHAAQLIKNPVELREAGEAALLGNAGDFVAGMDQQMLGFTDPGRLNILGQSGAGDDPELVRQVIRADEKLPGD